MERKMDVDEMADLGSTSKERKVNPWVGRVCPASSVMLGCRPDTCIN